MANKKTLAVTSEQYNEIISTIRIGFLTSRPNNQIATTLIIQSVLGIRIGDVLNLKLSSIIKDNGKYRLNITEEKTKKQRNFTVDNDIYNYLSNYCLDNNITKDELIFKISARAIQKHLKLTCDYLGYDNISTHSFRKYYATDIYNKTNHNIILVQQLLQHSSPAVTKRYININDEDIDNASKIVSKNLI